MELGIYVDSKWNEFKHRVTEGPVVCAPPKHDTGVEEGDTLYFHHLVVINEGSGTNWTRQALSWFATILSTQSTIKQLHTKSSF